MKNENYLKIFFILCICIIVFLLIHPKSNSFKADRLGNEQESGVWKNTPNLAIMCRVYRGSAVEYYNTVYLSYLLFWPWKKWANSKLVLIFDDESEADHRYGTIFGNLPGSPQIHFEKKPKQKTFCTNWRSEGYSRQQYSNFYADIYTDKEYVGFIDSDTFFTINVTPEDLFPDGKPRLFALNGVLGGHYSWAAATEHAVNKFRAGEFMVVAGFPLIIKTAHFKDMRAHITKRTNSSNFEEAWYKICSKSRYSQFDMMGNYLWNYKRNEYSWHIKDGATAHHYFIKGQLTNSSAVMAKNDPIISPMKHGNGNIVWAVDIFDWIYDYLCLASGYQAGDCQKYKREQVEIGSKKNLFTDRLTQTSAWEEREMAPRPRMVELPWSTPKKSWTDAYEVHRNNVMKRWNNDGPKFNKFL